ncbi:O-antigen ligase family protein, partial [Candidatus Saccharibacteria bacterium]|nr:O-antigen ligase family protein [Candidatus Saccharibacteria bacterium]
VVAILILLPFHAFLTVWLSSGLDHYTLLRLWKEFLLLPIALGALYFLVVERPLLKKIWSLWLSKLIVAYSLLLLACGFVALELNDVTAKAMWYGLLVDLRFLVFFLAVMVLAAKSGWLHRAWQKLLLAPAVLVAAFAILQYLVLPYDFLKHFGYSQSTIFPYETINHNLEHIRVASTLRGANPLGAYLLVPIAVIAALIFKEKRERRDKLILAGGFLLALFFSFSRSAWIGAGLALLTSAWLAFKSTRIRRNIVWILSAGLVIAAVLTLALRNNLGFENAVFHTDRNSKIAVSSNEGHSAAAKAAIKDVAHHPLGSGVGTAGPQSVYNHRARIAENYYLQIAQEAGVLGVFLFVAICVALGKLLFDKRADPLALALFASLIGLSFVNLLSHAWSDDTLAYAFWGLAAIALAPAIITDKRKRKNGQNIQKSA